MTKRQKTGLAVAAVAILLIAYGCGSAAGGSNSEGGTSTVTAAAAPASTVTETVTEEAPPAETVEVLSGECRRALVGMRAVAVKEQGAMSHYITAINLIAGGQIGAATTHVRSGTAALKRTTAKLASITDDYNNCLGG